MLFALFYLWLVSGAHGEFKCADNVLDIKSGVLCWVTLNADAKMSDITIEYPSNGLYSTVIPFPPTHTFPRLQRFPVLLLAPSIATSGPVDVVLKVGGVQQEKVQITTSDFINCNQVAQTAIRPCVLGSSAATGVCECIAPQVCRSTGYCSVTCNEAAKNIRLEGIVHTSTDQGICKPDTLNVLTTPAVLYGEHEVGMYLSGETEGVVMHYSNFIVTGKVGTQQGMPSLLFTHALVDRAATRTVDLQTSAFLVNGQQMLKVGGRTIKAANLTLGPGSMFAVAPLRPSSALPDWEASSASDCVKLQDGATLNFINEKVVADCKGPPCLDLAPRSEVNFVKCKGVPISSNWKGSGKINILESLTTSTTTPTQAVTCPAEHSTPPQAQITLEDSTLNLSPRTSSSIPCGACGPMTLQNVNMIATTLCVPNARFFGDVTIGGTQGSILLREVNIGAQPILIEGKLTINGAMKVTIVLSKSESPRTGVVYPLFKTNRGITNVDTVTRSWTATLDSSSSTFQLSARFRTSPTSIDVVLDDQTVGTVTGTTITINTGNGNGPVNVPTTCGDGRVDKGEACDDGNLIPGDGCPQDCKQVEQGFTCSAVLGVRSVCTGSGTGSRFNPNGNVNNLPNQPNGGGGGSTIVVAPSSPRFGPIDDDAPPVQSPIFDDDDNTALLKESSPTFAAVDDDTSNFNADLNSDDSEDTGDPTAWLSTLGGLLVLLFILAAVCLAKKSKAQQQRAGSNPYNPNQGPVAGSIADEKTGGGGGGKSSGGPSPPGSGGVQHVHHYYSAGPAYDSYGYGGYY